MRDLLIEEIFGDSRREQPRRPSRKDTAIPAASRYPRSAKRAEQERERQPWLKQPHKPDVPLLFF